MSLPFLSANSRLVLVSNSSSLLEKSLGKDIDSFDIVVRFNNFETTSFEAYVGRKTDIVCRRSCDDVKMHDATPLIKIINFVTFGKWTAGMRLVDQKLRTVYKNKLLTVNELQCRKIGEKIGLDQPHNEWASIGALACGWFAQNHDPKLIWLAGFDFVPNYEHYFIRKSKDSCFHNPQKEEAFIKSLGFNFLT